MNDLQNYLEYRDYLRDFYEEKKKARSCFSFRYMSDKLGIDASHLAKILQKQRHIANTSVESFISFCNLTGKDAVYFSVLVNYNKAKSERDIRKYHQRLMSLKDVDAYTLGRDQHEFYRKWYSTVVVMLLHFYRFDGDYKALARKLNPAITVDEAKEVIRLLKNLGLIREEDDGRLVVTNHVLSTGDADYSDAIRNFQEETLRLAVESLDRHSKNDRDISTVTITLAQKNIGAIHSIIQDFRSELLKVAYDTESPDRVYQLNIQLFPVTR